jgi:ligand-binding SRPBCC domain-containing protein
VLASRAMAVIRLETSIRAPVERCFDLSRSIDLHIESAGSTGERAIDGVTCGLIGEGQQVTWLARHFGVRQRLTSRITVFDRPHRFRDSMVSGTFRRFDHDHLFTERDGATLMTDVFDYEAPLGPLGVMAERLFLTRYLGAFLAERNGHIRRVAESNDWQRYLR